ncbi:heme ABC exporter ATP-binding protein CcmA [Euzebya tangerina]|uniref:heme ABC exporter ATP-binding protein CcmA n=1 Tax=Euzebya tangerina TaxID=591198 RepID=UPI0039C87295
MSLFAGECVTVEGHNGSGKTSLLRLLAGLVQPAAGHGEVLGVPLGFRPHLPDSVAMVGHETSLHPDLTVHENLQLVGDLLGRPRREIDTQLHRVGLEALAGRVVSGCSAGMRRRAEFARVGLISPDLLLLDEPDTSLDGDARQVVDDAIADVLGRRGTVVLVSHDPARAAMLATRRTELRHGRLAAV